MYNLNKGCVAPLSPLQETIIRTIAEGQRVSSVAGYDGEAVQKEMESLVAQNVLVPGRRRAATVDLPRLDKPPKPDMLNHVWLELTNSCNLTCSHCYAGSSPKIKIHDDLNYRNWVIVLDKLLRKGVKRFTFIGGEPMIHFDLMNKLITYIHEYDASIGLDIFSNLTLLADEPEWFSFLKKHNITFGTSLYGTMPETHDAITRKRGSWEVTVRSIRLLVKNGFSTFVGYYYNENEEVNKEEISAFIGSMGITNFKIVAPAKVGRGEGLDWQNSRRLNTSPKVKYFNADTFQENMFYHNCYKDVLTVKNDGTILPCIMTRDNPLMNLLHEELDVLENSSTYHEFVNMSKDKVEGCQECEFRYGCFDCRPEAFQGDKNLYTKSYCGYDPRLELQAPLLEKQ